MEKSHAKRHVAVIGNCIMSETGLSHLFKSCGLKSFYPHFFKEYASFKSVAATISFMAVIFSLPGLRAQRITCLNNVVDVAHDFPQIKRIILANDETEASLMNILSPSPLHGVISKTMSVKELKKKLVSVLNVPHWVSERSLAESTTLQPCELSQTEREILHYMTHGYSLPEIATRLSRNIKTVRAHKFNVMAKLGVDSDVGLLDAADLLMNIAPEDPLFSTHLWA